MTAFAKRSTTQSDPPPTVRPTARVLILNDRTSSTFNTLSDTGPTQIEWQRAVCAYLAAE